MTLPPLPQVPELESASATADEGTQPATSKHYELRPARAPRYRCGTCGLRDCTCVKHIAREPATNDTARGVGNPRSLKLEWDRVPNVRTIVLKAEKTFTSLDTGKVPPLETTIDSMEKTTWEDLPTYRFKEWSSDLSGLEFVI